MKRPVTCAICAKEKKGIITCENCGGVVCKSCMKRTLIEFPMKSGKIVEGIACILCKKEISLRKIRKELGRRFYDKELREVRMNAYISHERELLANNQVEAKEIRELYNLKKQIKENEKIISELKWDIANGNFLNEDISNDFISRKKLMEKENKKLRKRKATLIQRKKDIEQKLDSEVPNTNKYIKCIESNCKGYIPIKDVPDGELYTCGLCSIKICPICKEIKKKKHICDPNILESLKEIEASSVTCPICKVPIQKIEGCSQMFCTNCHTKFDYRTGEQIVGDAFFYENVHLEELRKTDPYKWAELKNKEFDETINANALVQLSQGMDLVQLIDQRELIHAHELLNTDYELPSYVDIEHGVIYSRTNKRIRFMNIFATAKEVVAYIITNELRKYKHKISDYNDDTNKEIRLKYLMNKYDEKTFIKMLTTSFKNMEYETELCDELLNLSDKYRDILNSFVKFYKFIHYFIRKFNEANYDFNIRMNEIRKDYGKKDRYVIMETIDQEFLFYKGDPNHIPQTNDALFNIIRR